MAFKFFIFIVAALFFSSCAHRIEIHDLKSGKIIDEEDLLVLLPEEGTIVLGEYHHEPSIQNAQSNIIRKIVTSKKREGQFTVGWEFLAFPDQKKIALSMEKWQNDEWSEQDFMKDLFRSEKSTKTHASYLPVLRTVKELKGELIGLNAPREWKKDILSKGLQGIDTKYKPVTINPGSHEYFERFTIPMKEHVKENSTLERFFEAQYYTDSIMAWAMQEHAHYPLRFLIAGSFHTDYHDGVVSELRGQSAGKVVTIKIVNGEKLKEAEMTKIVTKDPKYGAVADFVYFIR
jgi:uncharacterized iron-regulated protein